jgi:chromosome segregation ATPase
MDWLMGKIYTSIKGTVVITTAGCSIAIFTGLSSSIASYVLGSFVGVAALFLAFDTFGMAQALNKLNKENDRLHQSNEEYLKLNSQHETSINNLNAQNNTYVANNKALNDKIDLLTGENTRFKDSVTSLNQNINIMQSNLNGLQDQNTAFKANNQELQKRLDELDNNNQALNQQTEDLRKTNQELNALGEQQKRQIDSLRLVQAQSKQLIQALMTAGDDFKQFQSTLSDSMSRIETTSDAMTMLLDKLGSNQFRAIDADNNGIITRDELMAWSTSKK